MPEEQAAETVHPNFRKIIVGICPLEELIPLSSMRKLVAVNGVDYNIYVAIEQKQSSLHEGAFLTDYSERPFNRPVARQSTGPDDISWLMGYIIQSPQEGARPTTRSVFTSLTYVPSYIQKLQQLNPGRPIDFSQIFFYALESRTAPSTQRLIVPRLKCDIGSR
jgi:hypothetical protein